MNGGCGNWRGQRSVGRSVRYGIVCVFSALALAFGVDASAQTRNDEIRVTILDVGYNSAYRNGTWVPVDVLVENERSDVSGYLEVRTYWGSNQTQSPVYRVPVESPQHSRKRFRVHCLLNDTLRVDATLYHRGRRVVEVPSWVNVTPIRPTDSLVLIMDEISGNFTFLYNVLQDASGERRVYRHELNTEELSDLPGYEPCYSAFDLIIMSEIDPGRISVRHRELLRDYVESGGVLVACIGESATAYRGSWVEELLGVRVGETQLVRETDYAPLVLPAGMADRANSSRQYSVVALEPAANDVVVKAEQLVLATMRRVGSGAAVAIAVDGPSKALQDTDGYRTLWRDLAAMRAARRDLNYGQAAQAVAQQLPWISGVRIQPKSTVMAYLGLYFVVGIVANWLFWNRLKRREMAWVCLVVISIGFTAYAVTFGTLGRAKNSELSYIDVVEIPLASDTANRHSLAGVLTAGTAYYSGALSSEYALATEATRLDAQAMYGGRARAEFSPFTFIEGSPARVEGMRVGASELRLLHIENQIPVTGGVEGDLVHDSTGLRGTLINRTGFAVPRATLYFRGKFYPLQSTGDGWTADLDSTELTSYTDPTFEQLLERLRGSSGFWNAYGDMNSENLHGRVVLALMLQPTQGGAPNLDPLLGPYVVGWATRPAEPSFHLDEPIPLRMQDTLVIADVAVRKEKSAANVAIELPIQATSLQDRGRGYGGRDRYMLPMGARTDVYINAPTRSADLAMSYGALTIEVIWEGPSRSMSLFVRDPSGGELEEVPGEQYAAPEYGSEVTRSVYTIEDWKARLMGMEGQLVVTLFAAPRRLEPDTRPESRSQAPAFQHYDQGTFSIRATVAEQPETETGGDWKSWPLSKPSS